MFFGVVSSKRSSLVLGWLVQLYTEREVTEEVSIRCRTGRKTDTSIKVENYNSKLNHSRVK